MITYQLMDVEGNIEKEHKLHINDDDKLIMKYDSDKFSIEQVSRFYDMLKVSLENNNGVLPIPKGIDFQILSKNMEELK